MGLFGWGSGDPQLKKNRQDAKRIRRLVREKKYDDALATGLQYLRNVPHNHDVLFIVGGIYHMRKQYSKSLSYLDRAADIGSYDTDVLLLKADIHRRLGQAKRARDCCMKILEVDGKNQEAREILDSFDQGASGH